MNRNVNGRQFEQPMLPGTETTSGSIPMGPVQAAPERKRRRVDAEGKRYEWDRPQSRGQQGEMVTPLSRVINDVHKVDSEHHPLYGSRSGHPRSPLAQWTKPDDNAQDRLSLRDHKLKNIEQSRKNADWGVGSVPGDNNLKPLAIYYDRSEPTLMDGHHTLARHEALGHTEIAVQPREREYWGEDKPKSKTKRFKIERKGP